MPVTLAPPAPFAARVPEPDEPMTPEENAAYAAWVGSPLGRAIHALIAARALRRAALPEGGRVLCVAEGDGTLARALAARRPDARVLGTDLSPDMVARALARPRPPNLDFRPASAYDLSAVAPADLVVCAFSFHHLHRPADGLREMLRAVAPGGTLYVLDLRRDADAAQLAGHLAEVDPATRGLTARSVAAAHTIEELRALVGVVAAGGARFDVGRVRWSADDEAALLGAAPADLLPPLEHVRGRIDGLWVEAVIEAVSKR